MVKEKKKVCRKTKSSEIEELKRKISSLEMELLTIQGNSISESINMGNFQRKAAEQISEATNLLNMERKRNECLSFAFGEFRCRELLWLASQWIRQTNFNLTINGKNYDRNAVIAEIDSFLANMTFGRK